ncbi:hypothetical protein GCM10022200_13500 [Microbacterium awajiense]|uniref:LGFP repeat-containing protein n=1 Tax=Microbacterium awajiense TaxID=415214 RepID=A0ABP7AGQ2_9MICO
MATPAHRPSRVLARIAAVWAAVLALTLSVAIAPAGAAGSVSPGTAPATVAAPGSASFAATADLTGFDPGYIISDAVFFDKSSMTESQIQSFLQSKVSSCQSGYTCLKDKYDTSRSTSADAMCGAYSGGARERASRIIYKVAQACGINPQVILATLQKEQGLVTHTAPSEWRYTIAMGQGCPDTAACDTRYYGFFNQVYGAAWQFKRYANPPGTSQYFTWYAPGKTWNILYHPNRACGSSPVYVRNQATSNLYYYTPYQPNAAALRAGYAEGDGCSSYGNRNFYNYFTDWFGSTNSTGSIPDSRIRAKWVELGGVSGPGDVVGTTKKVSANGGGVYQEFDNGIIYATSKAVTYRGRTSAISVAYLNSGGPSGPWGWPADDGECIDGICIVDFQYDAVWYRSGVTTVGIPVEEPIASAWANRGGRESSGHPVRFPVSVDANGGGVVQEFSSGIFYSTGAGVTYRARSSAITRAYLAAGGPTGSWGWPVDDGSCSGGVCTVQFTHVIVDYSRGVVTVRER